MKDILGIAGISGAGKTTLITELQSRRNIKLISSTSVLMKIAGIIKDISEPKTPEKYMQLENISMKEKEELLRDKAYGQILLEECDDKKLNMVEIHLISPNRTKYSIDYQAYPVADWYWEVFSGVAFIDIESGEVHERVHDDIATGKRDRGSEPTEYSSIDIQRLIARYMWEDLLSRMPNDFNAQLFRNKQGKLDVFVRNVDQWISNTILSD